MLNIGFLLCHGLGKKNSCIQRVAATISQASRTNDRESITMFSDTWCGLTAILWYGVKNRFQSPVSHSQACEIAYRGTMYGSACQKKHSLERKWYNVKNTSPHYLKGHDHDGGIICSQHLSTLWSPTLLVLLAVSKPPHTQLQYDWDLTTTWQKWQHSSIHLGILQFHTEKLQVFIVRIFAFQKQTTETGN
jgi:hypothetical protein